MGLKEEFITLLKEDETFRYTVAGFLGLEEILKRLDRNEAELVRLREDMLKGFKRHDEMLEKHSAEIARLREDMIKGFLRHDEEIARLREDMMKGFGHKHLSLLYDRDIFLKEIWRFKAEPIERGCKFVWKSYT